MTTDRLVEVTLALEAAQLLVSKNAEFGALDVLFPLEQLVLFWWNDTVRKAIDEFGEAQGFLKLIVDLQVGLRFLDLRFEIRAAVLVSEERGSTLWSRVRRCPLPPIPVEVEDVRVSEEAGVSAGHGPGIQLLSQSHWFV